MNTERPIDRVLRWAAERGLSQTKLADAMGVAAANVTNWKSRGLPESQYRAAAQALGRTLDEVAFGSTSNVAPAPIGSKRIPVISFVQAGLWSEATDPFQPGDAQEWLYTDMEISGDSYALRIKGDSMAPDYVAGDVVIIDPSLQPLPGDMVVARNHVDEAMFKKYRPRGINERGEQAFELVPLNPDYPTIHSDRQPVRIIGVMVEHRKFRRR